MNINKKTLVAFVLLTAAIALALSGCMNSTPEVVVPEVTVAPGMTAAPGTTMAPGTDMTPGTNMMPGATDVIPNTTAPADGLTTATPNAESTFDWQTKAAMVEKRIDMLSEIQESRVIAYDQTALVGVKFASQYKGEMTQRIRDMIAGEVMAADAGIQVVAVTADAADVQTIYDLSDKLKTGVDVQTLRDDVDKIVRNTTTLR